MQFHPLTHAHEFRLRLYPRDFALTKAFYAETLQFPIVMEWDEGENDRGVMFATGTTIIELLTTEKPRHQNGCAVSLQVTDVHALWEQFKAVDFIDHALRDNPWGDSSFALLDPDGFSITFFTKHE